MLFPKRPDYKVVTASGAVGGSYSLPLSREFWLENIILKISGTTGTTMGTMTANGMWALLKRVRMSITDATGNRKVLDCPGFALNEYWRQVVGNLDRSTLIYAPSTTGVTIANSTAFNLYYVIPFRHPGLQDPFGAATMLPLPRLNNDPVLEIDIGVATDVSATFNISGSLTITALINRRDVLAKNFPYIPGELITYEKQWPSDGKQEWEIPSIGTVTGILLSDLSDSNTRATVIQNSSDWSLEYLSTVIRRIQPDFMSVENDHTVNLFSATWNNPAGSFYFDLLSDYAGQDAYNMGSALDVNPLVLNGGKAKLIGGDINGGSTAKTFFTVHKLFGDLRAVTFA